MKTVPVIAVSMVILLIGGLLTSMTFIQQEPEPWEIPDEYRNMENPVPADSLSLKLGETLYNKNCAFCHGGTGLGDGVKARTLQTFPGDLSGDYYQNQTDGEQFYKTKFGRDEMPAYENKFPDEDIWHMVNYMRTFKK